MTKEYDSYMCGTAASGSDVFEEEPVVSPRTVVGPDSACGPVAGCITPGEAVW